MADREMPWPLLVLAAIGLGKVFVDVLRWAVGS